MRLPCIPLPKDSRIPSNLGHIPKKTFALTAFAVEDKGLAMQYNLQAEPASQSPRRVMLIPTVPPSGGMLLPFGWMLNCLRPLYHTGAQTGKTDDYFAGSELTPHTFHSPDFCLHKVTHSVRCTVRLLTLSVKSTGTSARASMTERAKRTM